MFISAKSSNICHQLVDREYCLAKSHRRSYRILGKLITKCDYKFQNVWAKSSSQRISCDGTLIFFYNYTYCINCAAHQPYCKFRLQKVPLGKTEDALLTEGFPETVNLPHKGYRASLLSLTKDNFLIRSDIDNGDQLEEIYIGPPGIGFRTIQWNVVAESVALISTSSSAERRLARQQPDQTNVKQLVILTLFPLRFVCKFSVTKQVFGRHAVDVSVFLNLLTVMYSSGHIRMYSMERILKQCKFHDKQLYDLESDGTRYGVYPSYLTENVEIKELPQCLFEVRCRDRDVMLTFPPIYYIMWPFSEECGYCCFSFENGRMVDSGCISKPFEPSTYEDRVALHADDSGRIVHMTNTQLRLLKLHQNEAKNATELVEDFTVTRTVEAKLPSLKVSRSGRILKQRVIPDAVDMPERTVLTMVYSEEQDMIVLMSMQHVDCATIGFYDNWSGRLLHQFALEESVEEAAERSICFYLDTLVHVCKTHRGQFECNVYKLRAVPELVDQSQGNG